MLIKKSVAIVTGGSRGIGLAMSQSLLSRGARRVIVADVNSEVGIVSARQLNVDHGDGRCHFVRCDVTDKEQLRSAFLKAKELDGRIDIVVNNAGILDESRPSEMIDVNVKGVIWGSQLAVEFMSRENGGSGGVVVNTASIAGLFTSAFVPAYTATKHAVVGWTGAMGSDVHFKRHGIRFNCLCPAYLPTQMLFDSVKDDSKTTLMSQKIKSAMRAAPLISVDFLIGHFIELINNDEYNGFAVGILPPDKAKYLDKSMKTLI